MKIKIWLVLATIFTLAAAVFPPATVFAQNAAQVVAFTGQDGNIYFYHFDGSGLDRITDDGHLSSNPASDEIQIEYQQLAWSPDERRLAAVRQQSQIKPDRMEITTMVMVYDVQTRSWQRTPLQEIRHFTWNPGGTGLVFGRPVDRWTGKGQPAEPFTGIYQYDLTSGQETEILPAKTRPLSFPSFSRTGRYLVAYEVVGMEGLGNFVLYDQQTQDYRVWGPETGFAAASLNWSKDDSFVVFDQNTYSPSSDSKIYRAGPSFEGVTAISPQVEDRIFYSPRLSPSEDRVAAFSDPNPDTATGPIFGTIWVFNLDGSNARQVVAPTASIYFNQWAPDSRRLIYSSGDYRQETIQLVDVDSGQTELLGRGREFAVQPGVLSPAVQATSTPFPASTPIPTGQVVQAVTVTPAPAVQATAPVPPDRILPPAPAWLTPRLLAILLCAGSLLVMGAVLLVVILARRR